MSKSKHRRRKHGHGDDVGWPHPPKKTVERIFRHRRRKKVNTEVHDAIWSLGADDRTKNLSDAEFNGQVAGEIGYMFRLSGSHFKRACGALVDLYHALF